MSRRVSISGNPLSNLYIRRAEAERQLDGDPDPEEGSDKGGEGLTTKNTVVEVKNELEPKQVDVTMGN